ncbi:MAG: nucleoside-triphosphatase [Chloroflexota bacterium]
MPVQIDSPDSALADLSRSKGHSSQLILLSGPSGAGKSTWCLQLAEEAVSLDFVVAGLISPAVFENGFKIGINLVDQANGERRRLAVRSGKAEDGFKTEQWVLDPAALAWGNQILQAIPACDILILDELGPLEMEQGRGLVAGLDLIKRRHIPLIVAVVRPRLLPAARQRWPWGRALMMNHTRTETGGA